MDFTYGQASHSLDLFKESLSSFQFQVLGHAILIPAWIGGSFGEFISEENEAYLLITIAMHLASSVALCSRSFVKDGSRLISGSYRAGTLLAKIFNRTSFRVLSYIVIATIPVGVYWD